MRTKGIDSLTYKRNRRRQVAKKTGQCAICPPHDGENSTHKKHGTRQKRRNWRRK